MNNRPSKTAAQDCDGSDRCPATDHLAACSTINPEYITRGPGAPTEEQWFGESGVLDARHFDIISATATAKGIEAQFQITDPAILEHIRKGAVNGVSVSGRDLYEAIHALQQPEPIRTNAPRPTVYIAGPMTGHQGFNYHAFHYAAADLRAAGYTVLNPAETAKPNPDPSWQDWMRADLGLLIQADAIALLPGWQRSKGAMIEERIGRDLGLDVRPIMHHLPDEHQNWSLYTPSPSSYPNVKDGTHA